MRFANLKKLFFAMSLLLCFTLYAIGQIWLFALKQKQEDFYVMVTKESHDWINAHLVLMLSLLLAIPAYFGIKRYLKATKANCWIDWSILFICLWAFASFGQYVIDLCLVEIFNLPQETAYEILDKIQGNAVINALFYDNSQLLILFKALDFFMIAQICLGTALVRSGKMPKWALLLFFTALVLCTVGIIIHPIYGRIIKRLSYALFSVAFLPVAIGLFREKIKSGSTEI